MRHCACPGTLSSNRFRLFAGLALLLASATVASAAETIVDPCKLVTAAEAQAVVGSPATATSTQPPPRPDKHPVRICTYQGQNGKMMNIYAGHRTKADFDHERAGHEAMGGIGETAYYIPPGILSFLKGDTNVLIQAISFEIPRDKMKTLALGAAGRL